jgi:hypothetical protein
MDQAQPNTFYRGDIQMNTCLSALYLKLNQLDSRYIRLALMVLTLTISGGVILGLPINGDVGT